MKGGVLEVLLVKAEGLKHSWQFRSNKYVVIHCGNQTYTSKMTLGKDRKAWWNEKFIVKLSSSELKELDKIKMKIMEKEKLTDDRSIGDATIYLRNILREGSRRGCIELKPAPYNIVLKDGSYEGELKIGLKFSTHEHNDSEELEPEIKATGCVAEKGPQSIYRTIFCYTIRRIQWPRIFLFHKCANFTESKKDK